MDGLECPVRVHAMPAETPLFFECFPYVRPEPVLVKRSFFIYKRRKRTRFLALRGRRCRRTHRRPYPCTPPRSAPVQRSRQHQKAHVLRAKQVEQLALNSSGFMPKKKEAWKTAVVFYLTTNLFVSHRVQGLPAVPPRHEMPPCQLTAQPQISRLLACRNASSLLSFPYVCPEPVLVK